MKKPFLTFSLAALLCGQSAAQVRPATSSQTTTGTTQATAPANIPQQPPATAPQQQRAPAPRGGLDLTDYGIQIEPDARLIVMLAALDAAGWDATPKGAQPSPFRERLRSDQAGLDPALRRRMQDFYNRYKLPDPAGPPFKNKPLSPPSPAEQAARYVSLAYTLGAAPGFEAPARAEDLPAGVLDVLDFVPLMREFYRQSGMDERLPAYLKMYRTEGDRMRGHTVEMARAALSYLNTRPVTMLTERLPTADTPAAGDKKKKREDGQRKVTVLREKERRFIIVPELLAAPGAINFRIIGDDYYVVAPEGTDPRSSELRRGYLQYLVDPLVARFSREIAAKRLDIKQILDAERARRNSDITPDVFLSVSRSMVAAADARMNETTRLRALQLETSERLKRAGQDAAARAAILKESKDEQAAVEDAAVAQLAEAYERGAVLSFFFAAQLRSLEQSGFDLSNFISDMVASITASTEINRPAEYASAMVRFNEARLKSQQARASEAGAGVGDEKRAALIEKLSGVDGLLRLKDYTGAEARLLTLKEEYRSEPRIYFGLGQAAQLSAQDAIDEDVQAERLNRALQHYRQVVLLAAPETDGALISRAHVARGRILAFLERREEAIKEFDAAIAVRDVKDGAYKEAVAEKRKLTAQP